ncbi:MAG: hypothetical protein JWP89_4323 [Schlesneria sp.]|nr:hypothetical protein [Schlesneria sp.]
MVCRGFSAPLFVAIVQLFRHRQQLCGPRRVVPIWLCGPRSNGLKRKFSDHSENSAGWLPARRIVVAGDKDDAQGKARNGDTSADEHSSGVAPFITGFVPCHISVLGERPEVSRARAVSSGLSRSPPIGIDVFIGTDHWQFADSAGLCSNLVRSAVPEYVLGQRRASNRVASSRRPPRHGPSHLA